MQYSLLRVAYPCITLQEFFWPLITEVYWFGMKPRKPKGKQKAQSYLYQPCAQPLLASLMWELHKRLITESELLVTSLKRRRRPSSIVTLMEQNHTEEPSSRACSSWIPSSTLHSKILKKNGLLLFTNSSYFWDSRQTELLTGRSKGTAFIQNIRIQKVKCCRAHHDLTRDKLLLKSLPGRGWRQGLWHQDPLFW